MQIAEDEQKKLEFCLVLFKLIEIQFYVENLRECPKFIGSMINRKIDNVCDIHFICDVFFFLYKSFYITSRHTHFKMNWSKPSYQIVPTAYRLKIFHLLYKLIAFEQHSINL